MARWHGAPSLEREIVPAGAAGPSRTLHDGLVPQRSTEMLCMLVPLTRRTLGTRAWCRHARERRYACWCCRSVAPSARWHGAASLDRDIMPAGAAGPSHPRHDGMVPHRPKIILATGAAGPSHRLIAAPRTARRHDAASLESDVGPRARPACRTRSWQHCKRTHLARWHGTALLKRDVRPAGAAGPSRGLTAAL